MQPRMQESCIEAVACPNGVYYPHWFDRDMAIVIPRVGRGAFRAALDDQQRDHLTQCSYGVVEAGFSGNEAGFSFVRYQDVDEWKRIKDAAVPCVCRVVVGIEGNG